MPTTLPHANFDFRRVAVSASSSGDNTLLAAITGKKIRVVGGVLMAAGAVNAKFKSGASTDLTGLLRFDAAGSGVALPEMMAGLAETAAGEALVLNLSAATAVSGMLVCVVGE